MYSSEKTVRDVIAQLVDAKNRQAAWQFFILFSRFEYALKRCGFLKNKPVAEADWDKFGKMHQENFTRTAFNLQVLADAIAYYEIHPPRKQLQLAEKMYWGDPITLGDGEGQLIFLCRAVGIVRNNLFHGGKFPQMPVSDPSRDWTLIGHANELLFSFIELDSKVKAQFFEAIDD